MEIAKETSMTQGRKAYLRQLSHELRTPLTGILGSAQLLDDEELTLQQRSYVKDICQSGEELLSVITRLLQQNSQISESPLPLFVLLVEDNPIVQTVHTRMLINLGCVVEIASDANQALALSYKSYDIIFMDIGLPDKSGIEAAMEIRRLHGKQRYTPIIALTGYVQEEVRHDCLAAGIDEVATKPIDSTGLQALLKQFTT